MRFYRGGVTVSDYDTMPESRRRHLTEFMDRAEESNRSNGR